MFIIFTGLLFSIRTAISAELSRFNADSAWNYLLKQCSFGPRNPGSAGAKTCQDYLQTELQKFTPQVRLQPFTHYDARLKKTFNLNNIIAEFGRASGEKIIFCAHWDTRPRAEMDPDPAKRNYPILGANDGASGVAILLELARNFALNPPPVTVTIIFFDGEDYGRSGENWDYLLGSKYFAQTADPAEFRYAVLLDLVGDADLEIKREYNSLKYARRLQDKIWTIAEQINSRQFTQRTQPPVIDDHLSLIEIGIPAVDIIDFDYKYWHTQQDIPQHCSKESLEAVGKVLMQLIYTEEL